jgi:outer membrane protein TolC
VEKLAVGHRLLPPCAQVPLHDPADLRYVLLLHASKTAKRERLFPTSSTVSTVYTSPERSRRSIVGANRAGAQASRGISLGPAVSEVLFEGGLRRAQTEQARAVYDAEVAAYRQTLPTGFQEVEESLAGLRGTLQPCDFQLM